MNGSKTIGTRRVMFSSDISSMRRANVSPRAASVASGVRNSWAA
jgi:hypothetical protein